MAIAVKTQSKRERIGIAQRSKSSNHWADAANIAATGAFKEIHWLDVGQAVPDAGITVDQFNVTSQNGTHIEYERRFVDPNSGLVRVPFSGTADKSTLSIFLAAAMQTVSEGASTPYSKTFSANGLSALPNWANNEGYLFDIFIMTNASANDGMLIRRCLIDTLNISVDFQQKVTARLFKISGSFVGNQILYKQTPTLGNWTNVTAAKTFFNDQDTWGMRYDTEGTTRQFEVDAVEYWDEYLKNFTLSINNKIQGDNWGVGGIAGQYTWSPEYTGNINLWHNATTEAIIDSVQSDDLVEFALSNDAAAANTDGKFTILGLKGGVMTQPVKGYDADYVTVNLNVRFYSLSGASPISILFTDTLDYGY